MSLYTVHEPPEPATDLQARAVDLVFVRQGFSWGALLVPWLWLLYRRLWLEFAVFVVLLIALSWLFSGSQSGQTLFGWISAALIVFFAFEANDIRRFALERRGYRLEGVAAGRGRDDAELQFYRAWLRQQEKGTTDRISERDAPAKAARPEQQSVSSVPRTSQDEEIIGLFPRP